MYFLGYENLPLPDRRVTTEEYQNFQESKELEKSLKQISFRSLKNVDSGGHSGAPTFTFWGTYSKRLDRCAEYWVLWRYMFENEYRYSSSGVPVDINISAIDTDLLLAFPVVYIYRFSAL